MCEKRRRAIVEEKEKRTVEDSSPVDVDVGTAADVEAVMKKYDRESNTKIWEGLPKQVIRYAMALFMIFMVYVSMFSSMDGSVRRCWFLGLILVFVYIMYPIKKGAVTRVNYMPWYDIVLAVLSIGTFGYQIYFLDDLIYKGSRLDTIDIIIGTLAILLLIEACRRVVGIPIIVVVVAFMAYALLGSGMEFKDLIYTLFYTTQGILGTPIQVCSTYIFLFVLFGAFLEATGIAAFFIDLANAIAGSATGGPAKVAVISSALCGMVSGSSVGNTVTTGSVTIPLMKKTGYPPQFAGAVEAAASTGGQIMPPIMGAAAFLMAEMTGESYNTIIIRAILPAFLYFAGIFIMVHFKAKSMGLKGLKRSELPKFRDIWPKFYLLLPLVVLVYTVMQTGSFTMAYCAVVSSLVAIVASMMDREK
ncbi:MAG TPA: TRAP transporter fused permease subunit, partial [Candidatus Oscillibacter pullicola]|nr:TRAP transporter fused permease subunit [Candidatus Oscillibacter pullicola]